MTPDSVLRDIHPLCNCDPCLVFFSEVLMFFSHLESMAWYSSGLYTALNLYGVIIFDTPLE